MATLLELFTEDDFALIFEALESRKSTTNNAFHNKQSMPPMARLSRKRR